LRDDAFGTAVEAIPSGMPVTEAVTADVGGS